MFKPLPLNMDEQERQSILYKLKISQDDFDKLGLTWDALEAIFADHRKQMPGLETLGLFLANQFMSEKNIHSVRFRVKDPKGLIAKIIRKRVADPKRIIDLKNYTEEITDLVGIRAIHLMKNHWQGIDEMIISRWDLKEPKKAYIRDGDSEEFTKQFAEGGFEIKEHPFGYRSLHYIITTKPGKDQFYAEIQVRTIFEEGWSEIDHKVRYPNVTDNVIFGEFLSIFNRIAGSADEMGSFIMSLKMDQAEKRLEFKEQLREKDIKIKALEAKIEKLDIDKSEKSDLINIIGSINFRDGFQDSPFDLSQFTHAHYIPKKILSSHPLAKVSKSLASIKRSSGTGGIKLDRAEGTE